MKRKSLTIAAVTAVLVGGGAAAAVAGSSDDDATERPITGVELQRASEAALAHTGGGRVTDTEVGDEEGAYEVEVTKPGGGEVDVHLDRDFAVTSTEDEDGEDDEAGES